MRVHEQVRHEFAEAFLGIAIQLFSAREWEVLGRPSVGDFVSDDVVRETGVNDAAGQHFATDVGRVFSQLLKIRYADLE